MKQTFVDWECIIVNDGSSDDTARVASNFTQIDSRIQLINQENRGLSGARNRGIAQAKGDYIQFLDADDIIMPNKLELQITSLANIKNLKLSYCNHRFSEPNNLNKEPFPAELPRFKLEQPLFDIIARWETQLCIPVHSFLFDARLFHEQGISYDESLPNHEDWDCLIQIFALNPTMTYINQTLAVYRVHENSMCRDQYKMWLGVDLVLKKHLQKWNDDKVIKKLFLSKRWVMKTSYRNYRTVDFSEKLTEIALGFLTELIRLYRRFTPGPIQKIIVNISRVMTQDSR
jgi:glycosyltransferase involved in cell wall biosynthesis